MLEPLDTRILSALSREDSDDKNPEYDPRDHISLVKELITDTEDGNWTDGLMTLLGLWPRINPQFYRKKPMTYNDPRWSNGGPNNWWIEFNVRSRFHWAISARANHSSRTPGSVASALSQVVAVLFISMLSTNAFSRSKSWDVVRIGLQ